MIRWTLALATCTAVASTAAAQRPTFSTSVERVRIDALVTRGDRTLPGLTAADFEVTDDGVRQSVEILDQGAAIQVILALDTSGSVVGLRLEELVRASHALVRVLQPHDRAGLLTFSELVSWPVPATPDHGAVVAALDRLAGGGRTRLFDAAFAAVTLSAGETVRPLVLLFTDGVDTGSWLTQPAVMDAARYSDVVMYAVTLADTTKGDARPGWLGTTDRQRYDALEDLVRATGGRVLPVASEERLTRTFLTVLSEFRGRYVLVYEPRGVDTSDGWHSVQVKVKGGARVHARKGYMARR